MSRDTLTIIGVVVLHLLITSCNSKPFPNEEFRKFITTNINISFKDENRIQNSETSSSKLLRIKKSVVIDDKIICISANGSLKCLNFSNFTQDTVLEDLLNTDSYTDIVVFQDSLFATKNNKIFFWNTTIWVEYLDPLPINYFELLMENNTYAIYASCMGEFGSIIYFYNKKSGKTNAEYTECPNSVLKTNLGYFIGTHSHHFGGSSSQYIIQDAEKLPNVPDSIRLIYTRYDMDSQFTSIREVSLKRQSNYLIYKFHTPAENMRNLAYSFPDNEFVMINATFNTNEKLYHIIDVDNLNDPNQRLLGTDSLGSLKIIDTLENCRANSSFQYGYATIINEDEFGNGFTMVRHDTIYKVNFMTTP